jgi:glycosyltransferase involved in cell wall biosynthesis
MRIAAVCTCRNEADIIEASIRHLLAEGVDEVRIADSSTDATPDILRRLHRETGRVAWFEDTEPYHQQQAWVDRLAAEAEAEWIVPFDADEWWLTTTGEPLAKVLGESCENKLYAQLWHHLTPDEKYIVPERLPKVAYRWSPEAHIAPGNHDVSLPGGLSGLLEIRHYQYRGFDHYCRKMRERNATLAPDARARGDGAHVTRLDGATDEQLRVAWDELTAKETVYDPIPVHGGHRLDS